MPDLIPGTLKNASDTSLSKKTAGATLTVGMSVYKDSNGLYLPAQSNIVGTSRGEGIVFSAAETGESFTMARGGGLDLGVALQMGMIYCVSAANAGGIAPFTDLVTGNILAILGYAVTADLFQFLVVPTTIVMA